MWKFSILLYTLPLCFCPFPLSFHTSSVLSASFFLSFSPYSFSTSLLLPLPLPLAFGFVFPAFLLFFFLLLFLSHVFFPSFLGCFSPPFLSHVVLFPLMSMSFFLSSSLSFFPFGSQFNTSIFFPSFLPSSLLSFTLSVLSSSLQHFFPSSFQAFFLSLYFALSLFLLFLLSLALLSILSLLPSSLISLSSFLSENMVWQVLTVKLSSTSLKCYCCCYLFKKFWTCIKVKVENPESIPVIWSALSADSLCPRSASVQKHFDSFNYSVTVAAIFVFCPIFSRPLPRGQRGVTEPHFLRNDPNYTVRKSKIISTQDLRFGP